MTISQSRTLLDSTNLLPAPTASAGLPVRPAKKRHTMRLAKLLLNPAPSVKRMNTGDERRYTIFLPYFSLIGAEKTGPKASPMVYTVIPARAAVRETLKSAMMSASAGVYTEVPKVLCLVSAAIETSCY